MFKKVPIIIASTFAISLVAATIGLGVVAKGQATCGISQDGLVSLIGSSLSPTSNTLVASPEQLANAAADIVSASPECAVDVVVAVSTIRPNAATAVAEAVGAAVPDQRNQVLAVLQGFGEGGPGAPGAGPDYQGPYDAPFDDDDEDDEDDGFDDDDDDGASPS